MKGTFTIAGDIVNSDPDGFSPRKPGGSMAGTARELGDIVAPTGTHWTASNDVEDV